MVNLVISVLETAKHERIATEARRRRDQARQLRAEAEQLWQAAKAQFEAALLGEASDIRQSI